MLLVHLTYGPYAGGGDFEIRRFSLLKPVPRGKAADDGYGALCIEKCVYIKLILVHSVFLS